MPLIAWCVFLIFLLGEGMVREIGEVQEKGRIGYASHGQEKEKRERERKGVSVVC